MESEKPLLSKQEAEAARQGLERHDDTLPLPTTTTTSRKRQVARRLVLFSLISVVAVLHLVKLLPAPTMRAPCDADRGEADGQVQVQGYWDGVASKGMGRMWGQYNEHEDKHKHKHKYHDDNEGELHHKHEHHLKHKHGKGKHGHGPTFVPPKLAEHIFLSVPNNDSARAALERYTSYAHPAGSGFDFLSALNLKNEWERELGLRVSGPEDNLYDAGSAASQARILDGMDKAGVWVDTYYPVMNTPVDSAVTLYTDPPFHAKLREDIVDGDPTSQLRDEVRVFHGLSVSGDVTGKLVYVGYGRKRDFEALEEKGVDLKGKIAIVKYGGVFRGLKIKAAQEAGAIGCIIFTDPGDDGEITEENGYETYPVGPARQPSSVQRGSVQFLSIYPGDPTTPGEPAYKNATRIKGANFPSIPSLPMSYEDAIALLKSLKGKGVKAGDVSKDWVGGLGYYDVEYWTGPSEVDVRLMNEVNTRVMPIWNTMATIPGHITDEVIVLGNHRDAWILGGSDPNSGTATQYELIRGLGKLLRKGWKPLRTIVLASWDAEEYGLIGSTEWAEDFGEWISNNTAAYFNLDSSVSGSNFGAAASPSLAWLVREAAEEINTSADPSRSAWDTQIDGGDWEVWRTANGLLDEDEMELAGKHDTGVKPLGSGSDFTAFLQRYGVAAGNIGYGGGPKDPVYHYHSIYDSFTWQDKFADKGFHKHADAAKILGLILLRLSDSLILPINTTQYALEMGDYLHKVESIALTASQHLDGKVNFTALSESIDDLVHQSKKLDEQKVDVLKRFRKVLPHPPKYQHKHGHGLGFVGRIARWWWSIRAKCGSDKGRERHESHLSMERDYGHKYEHDIHHGLEEVHPAQPQLQGELPGLPHLPHPGTPHPRVPIPPKKKKEIQELVKEIRGINKKLQYFEGGFISEEGIKDREWYKHKGVAPGKWLGYGATTFPALTEALTIEKSTKLAQKEADELEEMIGEMAKRLAK